MPLDLARASAKGHATSHAQERWVERLGTPWTEDEKREMCMRLAAARACFGTPLERLRRCIDIGAVFVRREIRNRERWAFKRDDRWFYIVLQGETFITVLIREDSYASPRKTRSRAGCPRTRRNASFLDAVDFD